jgi:hypothetical protein
MSLLLSPIAYHFGFRRQKLPSVRGLDHAFTIVVDNFRWTIMASTPSLAGLARRWVALSGRPFTEFTSD